MSDVHILLLLMFTFKTWNKWCVLTYIHYILQTLYNNIKVVYNVNKMWHGRWTLVSCLIWVIFFMIYFSGIFFFFLIFGINPIEFWSFVLRIGWMFMSQTPNRIGRELVETTLTLMPLFTNRLSGRVAWWMFNWKWRNARCTRTLMLIIYFASSMWSCNANLSQYNYFFLVSYKICHEKIKL